MRMIGLDLGSETIGVALGDAAVGVASPLVTLSRAGGQTDRQALQDLVVQHDCREIVLGLPLRLDGSEGISARKVRAFGTRLASALSMPVHYVDERFTSAQANSALSEGGVSRETRKRSVDKIAAALILQAHFDARKGDRSAEGGLAQQTEETPS